ncbi:HDOD domain-containing protein [Actinotalea sp.]|uniref:HDOD domain-containing protein n=1 Tax=Actinotalea sp. TaxID=1872145 RepID=UPI0035651260
MTTLPVEREAAVRSSVHREAVRDLEDRVIGYSVTVSLDLPDGPVTDAIGALAAGSTEIAEALHRHYLDLDLAGLGADRYVFVPATPAMLDGSLPTTAARGRLVVDLPSGFELGPDAERRARALTASGAVLALPSYRGTPEQDALLPCLGFVVVDAAAGFENLAALVARAHRAEVRVLARLQDRSDRAVCADARVDGLRGGAGERGGASGREHKVLRPGQLQCLAALHLLQQEDVTMSKVAEVIDTEPVLTVRVLHLVNSGAFALRNRVDTVRQAVVLLGVREVTTLVTALTLDARVGAMDSLWHILARALCCEALAGDPAAYTAGMLSALIDELGVPADVVLEAVGVSSVVADAVRELSGELGLALAAVLAHERRDLETVAACGYDVVDVSDVYLRCLSEALGTARAVSPA